MTSNSPHVSTTSLISNETVTSKTVLVPQQPAKDYSTAFANLQSKYGTVGNFPTPVAKPSTSQKQHSTSHPISILTSQSTTPSTSPSKNFEASFGKLSSSYGFGGISPNLPHKGKDSKTKSGLSLLQRPNKFIPWMERLIKLERITSESTSHGNGVDVSPTPGGGDHKNGLAG